MKKKDIAVILLMCVAASVLVTLIVTEDVPAKIMTSISTRNDQASIAETNTTGSVYFKEGRIVGAHVPQAQPLLDLLKNAGYNCLSLTGGSMQPTLFTGNVRCSIPYNATSDEPALQEGYMITFQKEDNHTTNHRIIAVYDDYVITQGDNNYKYQEKVNKTSVLSITLATVYT